MSVQKETAQDKAFELAWAAYIVVAVCAIIWVCTH